MLGNSFFPKDCITSLYCWLPFPDLFSFSLVDKRFAEIFKKQVVWKERLANDFHETYDREQWTHPIEQYKEWHLNHIPHIKAGKWDYRIAWKAADQLACFCFNKTHRYIGMIDGYVQVIDLESRTQKQLGSVDDWVSKLDAKGERACAVSNSCFKLWDIISGQELLRLSSVVHFERDEGFSCIYARHSFDSYIIRVYDANTGNANEPLQFSEKINQQFKVFKDEVFTIGEKSDGRHMLLISSCSDRAREVKKIDMPDLDGLDECNKFHLQLLVSEKVILIWHSSSAGSLIYHRETSTWQKHEYSFGMNSLTSHLLQDVLYIPFMAGVHCKFFRSDVEDSSISVPINELASVDTCIGIQVSLAVRKQLFIGFSNGKIFEYHLGARSLASKSKAVIREELTHLTDPSAIIDAYRELLLHAVYEENEGEQMSLLTELNAAWPESDSTIVKLIKEQTNQCSGWVECPYWLKVVILNGLH